MPGGMVHDYCRFMEQRQADPVVTERLRDILTLNEQRLRAALNEARAMFEHRGVRGGHVEEAVRDFLGAHLSRRFDVGHGEVFDRYGHRAAQTDVLILSEDQPFRFPPRQAGSYIVEGVAPAGEVKSRLDSSSLTDCLDKARAFRALALSIPEGAMISAPKSDLDRYYSSHPYFAVAVESSMTIPRILERLARDRSASEALRSLDALFVLDMGAFIDFGDGEGSLKFQLPDGAFATGWQWVAPPERVLAELFVWLHAIMPKYQTWRSATVAYFVNDGSPAKPDTPS